MPCDKANSNAIFQSARDYYTRHSFLNEISRRVCTPWRSTAPADLVPRAKVSGPRIPFFRLDITIRR